MVFVFIAGFVVTLIVTAAIALLVYAAVLDGRDGAAAAARRAADRDEAPAPLLSPSGPPEPVEGRSARRLAPV